MLRGLIEDVLRAQGGQVNEAVVGTAATAENLIVDGPTSTAFGTIRTNFAGLSLVNVPATGALPAKQAFGPLCRLIVEATQPLRSTVEDMRQRVPALGESVTSFEIC